MAERMNAQARDRILAGLDRISDLVEAGTTPNRAVAAVAKEAALPPGHVRLMVQAFNTGRANFHRKRATSVLDKSSTVPLADASVVLGLLEPPEKSAAARRRSEGLSSDYLFGPDQKDADLAVAESSPLRQRVLEDLSRPSPPLPRSTDAQEKRARAALQAHTRLLDEEAIEIERWTKRAEESYRALDELARVGGLEPWPAVRRELTVAFGSEGERLCRHLDGVHGRRLSKRAGLPPAFSVETSPWKEAADFLEAMANCNAALSVRAADVDSVTAASLRARLFPGLSGLKEAASRGDHEETGGNQDGQKGSWLLGSLSNAASSVGTGMRSGASSVLSGLARPLADKALSDRSWKGKDDKALQALTDPTHEFELRRIRSTAMLHDLMRNDPVLSERDPEEVLGAFTELQSLAPRLLHEPSMARMLLRKHLAQGGVDVHELKQIADGELTIRRARDLPASAPDAAQPVAGSGRGYVNSNVKVLPQLAKNLLGDGDHE